ncbi:unnamed protein product [Oppiella nova]|uniref:Uncharacterized protein n=1 Tax=Oppiella nova TaxID=334625 RepID=A0A7R9L734_9ACAR|nr:unnamed protein product [Oppiella nova]CAG2155671.1 unnamed protein product [Oppiella nova]
MGIASVAMYADDDIGSLHVELADEAWATMVHPGYGFLSERAEFAQAVIDAGLKWVGPSPEAITKLGDKIEARKIAASVGAPLVQGTQDPLNNADEALAFAKQYGLPIAIKAAFGGGGRGLKVVWKLEEVKELYDSAVREAKAAFGRGECFVEQYLDNPRHVEAQVIADLHGNVVVLEVNTRLQVEHPVTEETARVDLVVEQIQVALGEELSIKETPKAQGHAIEFRINAEDPSRGSLVSSHFDSLMAKLIVTGETREIAIRRAKRALKQFKIEGVASVLDFHRAVLNEPDFTDEFKAYLQECLLKVQFRWSNNQRKAQSSHFNLSTYKRLLTGQSLLGKSKPESKFVQGKLWQLWKP